MGFDSWPMLEYMTSTALVKDENALKWFVDREQYKQNTHRRIRKLFKFKLAWDQLSALNAKQKASVTNQATKRN